LVDIFSCFIKITCYYYLSIIGLYHHLPLFNKHNAIDFLRCQFINLIYFTPSIKKSIKARTTGKAKRAVKKALIPGYGKKGAGWIKNPKKAAYNKVYKKTSFGIMDLFK
jgi:hypothetical protein